MLNARGGIECDFTVTRLAEDRFRIVTGTAFGRHDLAWIRQHAPEDGSVHVEDVTSRYACLGHLGPGGARDPRPARRRRPLLPVHAGEGGRDRARPCLALRVTYVGELGWELYCATELGLRLWDTIWEAGRPHGLVAGGYKAIDSCRLEKGYRVWGADISPEDTPYEAGLGFAVKLDKGDFVGREALLERQQPERRLACLVLDDPRAVALGSEPVRVDGDDRRPGHERRLRLHGRALDRLRVRPHGARRAGDARRGRGLRPLGSRGGRGRASVRPGRYAGALLAAASH